VDCARTWSGERYASCAPKSGSASSPGATPVIFVRNMFVLDVALRYGHTKKVSLLFKEKLHTLFFRKIFNVKYVQFLIWKVSK